MSFREEQETTAERVDRLEGELRDLRRKTSGVADRRWRMVEVGVNLHVLYLPTGTLSPAIGTQ